MTYGVVEVAELLGISEDATHIECHCGHSRWEHSDGNGLCLHADHVGDWGEYNEWCRCNSYVENLPFTARSR